MWEGEQSERGRGRMTEKGVGWEGEERRGGRGGEECSEGTVTHADRLCWPLIGCSGCQSEELGAKALLGEQIMKRSSTSGSLLSLSQWLHTRSSCAPLPCCPLSAGLGSPSLMRSFSLDLPLMKCLKSWTGGKSTLSMAVNRGGV